MIKAYHVASVYTSNGVERDKIILVDDNNVIVDVLNHDKHRNYDQSFYLNGILFPSFVNSHSHLELSHLKLSHQAPKNLWDWILFVIQRKRDLTYDEMISSMALGEKFFYNNHIGIVGDIRSLLPQGPFFKGFLRGRIFFEVLGYLDELFDSKLNNLEKFLLTNFEFKGISIHSFYTTPLSKAKKIIQLAENLSLPLAIHLGETVEETELLFNNITKGFHKIFPSSEFEKNHFHGYGELIEGINLSSKTLLIHCVELTKKDLLTVKKRNLSIILCPSSNLYWKEKLPDFPFIVENDIRFALGTDSHLTNSCLDLIEDAKILFSMTNGDINVAKKILYALTYGGRELLFLNKDVFKKGMPFDCLFIENIYNEEDLSIAILEKKDKIKRV